MKTVIFDLDGTLANMEARRKFITGELGYKSWKKFFSPVEVVKDLPIYEIINLTKLYKNAGYRVLIFTGRDEISRAATEAWLSNFGVQYDKMLMRPEGSHKPDQIMKRAWLDQEFPDETWKIEVEAVYDDRNKVVKMFREAGLRVFQVAEGDF